MKVVSIVPDIHSTAVEHVGKHFDLVLGVDIHWTKLPFPPFPLPLPHPFIGFIFDPMDMFILRSAFLEFCNNC